jgi:hypothetical protein
VPPPLVGRAFKKFKVRHYQDDTGGSIIDHVAGVDDFEVAEATYRAALARWPGARITLRHRADEVIE